MKDMIQPWDKMIECEGRVSYHESVGVWNTFRLKKNITDSFPVLKDKLASIKYKLELYRSYDQLLEKINKLKAEGAGIPMLLFLYKE